MHYSSEELIAFRRDLHQHPELSLHEKRTASKVTEALTRLGLEAQRGVGGEGVVALIEGSQPGPVLLYRADIDALPIQEVEGRPYGSKNPGVMHACGHDVHTTIGIGVASELVGRRDELRGAVKMVFQPAEEASAPPGEVIGAEWMVRDGVLESPDVDAAFALHVMPELDVGWLAGTGGPVWASSDVFEVVVKGQMAHAAFPHQGRDAVLAASQIVVALQQIVARELDPREPGVITVGSFHAGTAHNILAPEAVLKGTIRALSDDSRDLLLKRFAEVVHGVAAAHGCSATIQNVLSAALTANHPELEQFALNQAADTGISIKSVRPQMGAEDFSAFSRRVPSSYLYLGVRNEARGITSPLHTPTFDVDERCIDLGVAAMTQALLRVGQRWPELELAR